MADAENQDRVYFIQESGCLSIKIGHSKNIKHRLVSLQLSTPYDLILLGYIPGGAERENQIHKELECHWIRGEWFSGDVFPYVDGLIDREGTATRAHFLSDKNLDDWLTENDLSVLCGVSTDTIDLWASIKDFKSIKDDKNNVCYQRTDFQKLMSRYHFNDRERRRPDNPSRTDGSVEGNSKNAVVLGNTRNPGAEAPTGSNKQQDLLQVVEHPSVSGAGCEAEMNSEQQEAIMYPVSEMFTQEEAAKILGVHVVTLRRWAREGFKGRKLTCVRNGRCPYYRREDIEAFQAAPDPIVKPGKPNNKASKEYLKSHGFKTK